MPVHSPKGRPQPMRRSVARWVGLFLGSARYPGDTGTDPGRRQRNILRAMPLIASLGGATVAQTPKAHPAATFTGYTEPAQIIGVPVGLASVDPVAGVSQHGAGQAARLPGSKTKARVV